MCKKAQRRKMESRRSRNVSGGNVKVISTPSKNFMGTLKVSAVDYNVYAGRSPDLTTKDHINASKEYACEWRTCSRVGHKQGRSLLLTHIRGHTGERPYSCTIPGTSLGIIPLLRLVADFPRHRM